MKYDFDRVVDRKNTDSAKWDNLTTLFGNEDVIPMFVADMDFNAPPAVVEAIRNKAAQGIYGYPKKPASYNQSILNWFEKRHGWEVDEEWLSLCPGVLAGLSMALQALSEPGDKVIVQPPVYFPFYRVVENNGRRLTYNPLIFENGRYAMDFEDLAKRADSHTRLMILCNPHNPVGRVWSEDDLEKVGRFCLENNIILLSDEIHSDLLYAGVKHVPTAMISAELAQNTLSFFAPSKTFNLAGLRASVAIIPNQDLRNKYDDQLRRCHMGDNTFGLIALDAAYKHGEEWLEAFLEYQQKNMEFALDYFEEKIPRIKPIRPEGTYMLWLDCRDLGLDDRELGDFMAQKARVGLTPGHIFGPSGSGFQRMIMACSRATLEKALTRIEEAVRSLNLR